MVPEGATIADAWTSIWYVSAAVMYLSLFPGAAISRISENRSTNTVDADETVEASLAVRRTVGCWAVDCAVAISPVVVAGLREDPSVVLSGMGRSDWPK